MTFHILDSDHLAFRAQKIKVGTQDLRIVAIALSQNATVITRNKRDFERIPALNIEDWSLPTSLNPQK